MDQNTFMETLASVKEIMQVQEEPLSEDEIFAYFTELNLSDAQKTMVLEYLNQPDEEEQDATEATVEEENQEKEDKKSAVFQMYLDELGELPTFSHTEELELYRALLSGDESAIVKLLDCWLGRVIEQAKGYMTEKLLIEDLVQEGNMALFMKLQEMCGMGKCDDVEENLAAAVEEAIMKYASELTMEREQEEAMFGKIRLVYEARKYLTEENGDVPSLQELSEYTKIPSEELEQIVKILDEKPSEK